ncbi:MAG: type II toxin-antitoxin system RelE/ParE family toxin [Clostridiales bacterium]|nr:type II toxin-antitoxin system RelE/ParE family toxin [Clostridiales bacterium]
MYKVDISPAANSVLEEYTFRCAKDNGEECALRLLDAFDDKITYLESTPHIGCARLRHVPAKYRVLNFWSHLWFVFQIKEEENCVKIEYIIDDRQNYGTFLK